MLQDTVDELQDELALVNRSLQSQESTNHDQIAEQQLLHTQLEQCVCVSWSTLFHRRAARQHLPMCAQALSSGLVRRSR